MNNKTVAKLMLSGLIFALIMFGLMVMVAVAVAVYFLGATPDTSFLLGMVAAMICVRTLVEAIDASL